MAFLKLPRRDSVRFMSLLVRQHFSPKSEQALNAQINMELKASHDYLSMAYNFNRCDVAMPGVFKFFQEASAEERDHAETIMKYMNKRGGQICLTAVPEPKGSYGSVLEAMKTALDMEMVVNDHLHKVHLIASQENDPSLCDFIESNFLQEQVDAIKQLADYIRQIERCQKELGEYVFDESLQSNGSMHGEKQITKEEQ